MTSRSFRPLHTDNNCLLPPTQVPNLLARVICFTKASLSDKFASLLLNSSFKIKCKLHAKPSLPTFHNIVCPHNFLCRSMFVSFLVFCTWSWNHLFSLRHFDWRSGFFFVPSSSVTTTTSHIRRKLHLSPLPPPAEAAAAFHLRDIRAGNSTAGGGSFLLERTELPVSCCYTR